MEVRLRAASARKFSAFSFLVNFVAYALRSLPIARCESDSVAQMDMEQSVVTIILCCILVRLVLTDLSRRYIYFCTSIFGGTEKL